MKRIELTHIARSSKGNNEYFDIWIGDGSEKSNQEMVEALLSLPYVIQAYPRSLVKGMVLPINIRIDPRYHGNLTESLERFAEKHGELNRCR